MRRVAAHVFLEDVEVPALKLSEADFHHLSRVLRLRPGEAVSASDGAGRSLACRWTGARALEPAGDISYQDRPWPPVTVAFALTKGEHPEWAVQKLTEAGVDRVIVMTTARCVARWGAGDSPRRLARLREVARQAAMQSRRVWLTSVDGPLTFSQLVSAGGVVTVSESSDVHAGAAPAGAAGVALAVPEGSPPSLATPTVLVGPEGGWSDEELAAVVNHVALGPHVLRAETAALAAGVLLAALRSHLVAEVPRAPTTRSCR